jgi:hypothetical protein
MFSGIERTIELPITREEYNQGMHKWKSGAYVQDAFPTLNADQREFIKSGVTKEEWEEEFKDIEPVGLDEG